MRSLTVASLLVAGAVLDAGTASACSLFPPKFNATQIRERARRDVTKAAAIIDAEVVETMVFDQKSAKDPPPQASLRVLHRWKGPARKIYRVGYITSCDVIFAHKGEHVRVLLTDGPRLFRADTTSNGAGVVANDQQLKAYNSEVDRLLGRQRPVRYSNFPGAAATPADQRRATGWRE